MNQFLRFVFEACLHGCGGALKRARRVTPPWLRGLPGLPCLGGSLQLLRKSDQINMRNYEDRWVSPPKRITSPIRRPRPPYKYDRSKLESSAL